MRPVHGMMGVCVLSALPIRAASGGVCVRMHDGKHQQLRADRMNGVQRLAQAMHRQCAPQHQKIDSRLLDFYGTIGVEVGHAHP